MLSDRRSAILKAREIVTKNPLYLDTETTGTGPTAEIVELGIVDSDGKVLYDGLIKPLRSVPVEAYNVHHIGDAELANAPLFRDEWPKIESIIFSGLDVVIYNADFDSRMIRQCYDEAFGSSAWYDNGFTYKKFSVFCAMKLYAQFYGEINPRRMEYRWQKLEQAGAQCGIQLPNSHRAVDDALLARAVMLYMAGQEVS